MNLNMTFPISGASGARAMFFCFVCWFRDLNTHKLQHCNLRTCPVADSKGHVQVHIYDLGVQISLSPLDSANFQTTF